MFSSICLSVQAQEELRSIAEALGTIEELDLRAHVEVLADDSLEGREAGSRGGLAAAKYIALHMQKYGLEPANKCWLNVALHLRKLFAKSGFLHANKYSLTKA